MTINIFSWCDHQPETPAATAHRPLLSPEAISSAFEQYDEFTGDQLHSLFEQLAAEQRGAFYLMDHLNPMLTQEAQYCMQKTAISIWQCYRQQFPNLKPADKQLVDQVGSKLSKQVTYPPVCICSHYQREAMRFTAGLVEQCVTDGEFSAVEGVLVVQFALQFIEVLDRVSAAWVPPYNRKSGTKIDTSSFTRRLALKLNPPPRHRNGLGAKSIATENRS